MSVRERVQVLVGVASLALAPLGCSLDKLAGSGGAGGAGDATTSSDAATTQASSAVTISSSASTSTGGDLTAPMVSDLGGPVLASPKALTITYDSDPHQAAIDAFVSQLGASSYWSATTSEYGVGALVASPPIHLTSAAPTTISDQAIVTMLKQNLQGANPAWGAADPATNYVFVFPEGTSVDSDGLCCTEAFDAYHGEASVGAKSVSYSVVCECPGYDGPALDVEQSTTAAISHELVESATDPFYDSNPAYAQSDDAHAAWTVVTGGEVADMCEYLDDAYVSEGAYTVQRSWSNQAAAAGNDPCVPADLTTAYFNSIPQLDDDITINWYNGPWATKGVHIPAGQSKTIVVDLISNEATSGPWTVEAEDQGISGNNLTFSWDKTTGITGDKLSLTITVVKADTLQGGEPFDIVSILNGRTSVVFGMVGN